MAMNSFGCYGQLSGYGRSFGNALGTEEQQQGLFVDMLSSIFRPDQHQVEGQAQAGQEVIQTMGKGTIFDKVLTPFLKKKEEAAHRAAGVEEEQEFYQKTVLSVPALVGGALAIYLLSRALK